MLLHVIKEANDVVKGKANVTKEFAKAQRQIYKLISQMPQISAAQMSENMGITNPGFNGRTFFDSGLQIRKDA